MSSDHVKLQFHILNTFTKKDTCPNMLCFMRDNVLASKTAKIFFKKVLRILQDFNDF